MAAKAFVSIETVVGRNKEVVAALKSGSSALLSSSREPRNHNGGYWAKGTGKDA